MSDSADFFGGAAGAPVGTIVTGNINDPKWLPLDNGIYLKADYPLLDTSKMLTFDGQSTATGPILPPTNYRVISCGGDVWFAYSSSSSAWRKSTDNGVTWSSGTLPADPASGWGISYANGMFFFVKGGTSIAGAATYYTSPDGVTWTLRSFPSQAGSQTCGGVAYINNLYVAIPAYASSPLYAPHAFYSADGITWTAVQLLYYGTTWGALSREVAFEPAQSRRTGLAITTNAVGGGTSYETFWTVDGVNWARRYHSISTGSVFGPRSTASEDAFGNLVDSSYVWSSSGTFAPVQTNRSIPGTPLGKSNIHTDGSVISEDHGVSTHRLYSPGGGYAFSGSRLLSIANTGVVSWIDVSSTKFRMAPLPMKISDVATASFYLKAR